MDNKPVVEIPGTTTPHELPRWKKLLSRLIPRKQAASLNQQAAAPAHAPAVADKGDVWR